MHQAALRPARRRLAYATCSLLPAENGEHRAFLDAHPDFRPLAMAEAWSAAIPEVAPPAQAIAETSAPAVAAAQRSRTGFSSRSSDGRKLSALSARLRS